jgi:hypothetical protein
MPQTSLSDLIVPEVFTGPSIEMAVEKNEFIQSGIIYRDPDLPIGSGTTVELPFYNDLNGEDNVWGEEDIELNRIDMAQDTAVVLTREKAWGRTDLSAALGAADPAGAIQQLVSGYWARRQQATLLAHAKGTLAALAGESPGKNSVDISGLSGAAAYLDGESFIDGTAQLGDRSSELSTVAVHSATEAWLRKNDLIEDVRDSAGVVIMSTFQGRRVIIDDTMPFTGSGSSRVFDTYLFGAAAVSMVEETVENATEVARHPEKKGGTWALYTRRKFVLHVRGVRWTPASGVPAKATPSNAELSNAANWSRVWDPKHIRLVRLRHKIG